MKPIEVAGVSVVGFALSAVSRKFSVPYVAAGALLYVLGVFIGAKRPSSGWMGMFRRRRA